MGIKKNVIVQIVNILKEITIKNSKQYGHGGYLKFRVFNSTHIQ